MAKKELKLHISEDNFVLIEDKDGGITLKNAKGGMIKIASNGDIEITNGKASIKLEGANVKING